MKQYLAVKDKNLRIQKEKKNGKFDDVNNANENKE
jgi:hypothetical protein